MTVSSYRLDTVAVHLIERLEGARRSYQDRPAEGEAAFVRIADEELGRIIAEHDELLDDPGYGDRLHREVHETFLPRYVRLAADHTALEAAGYHAWRRGDPVARGATTLGALLVALGFVRTVHHPVALVVFAVVLLVPFLPEIRRGYHRRQYRRLLQEVVADLGRIQERLDAYSPDPALEDLDAPSVGAAAPTASASPRPRSSPRKEPPT
jgi:hypothetical protein